MYFIIISSLDVALFIPHQVSYLEIYNEVINDLLAPASVNLKIREEKGRGVYVDGLKEEVVVSPEQVMSLIAGGEGMCDLI